MEQPQAEEEAPPKQGSRAWKIVKIVLHVLFHIIFIAYFCWCTYVFIVYDKKSKKCKKPVEEHDEGNATTPAIGNETTTQNVTTTTTTTVAPPANATETESPPFIANILCEWNWCTGYGFLILLFVFFYIFWIYYWVFKPYIGKKLYDNYIDKGIDKWIEFSRKKIASIVMLVIVIALVLAYLGYECRDNPRKLVGLSAPILFIILGFAMSESRRDIRWRIVVHGLLFQLILGIFCIRLAFGRAIFDCAGERVTRFLRFTEHGALFVYGERICKDYVFAFAILAVIFFFSVVTSILYYLGIMQFVLGTFGYLLQATVGTTICESINAVGNIFLGMSESPLMIRPYIEVLTASELHSICVSGYATVAGSVLGAYISFGASPAYLITASVMAAPGSLAFAKLFYPETDSSRTTKTNIELERSTDESILDAAASGAAAALQIVLGIVSNIIAFLAIVFFLNAVVAWFFELAGADGIDLTWILAKIFTPLVFLMGVLPRDCEKIAEVVAEKTLINEFVAYKHLGDLIKADKVLPRSAGIATFALCGFANPGSLGIMIAALSAMAPSRKSDITRVALRAFLAGSIVSFTSASIAGILIQEAELSKLSQKYLIGVHRSFFSVGDDYNDYGSLY